MPGIGKFPYLLSVHEKQQVKRLHLPVVAYLPISLWDFKIHTDLEDIFSKHEPAFRVS